MSFENTLERIAGSLERIALALEVRPYEQAQALSDSRPQAAPEPKKAEEAPAPAPVPAPSTEELMRQIRELGTALAKDKSHEELVALMRPFGATKVSQVDPARYPELLKAMQEAVHG